MVSRVILTRPTLLAIVLGSIAVSATAQQARPYALRDIRRSPESGYEPQEGEAYLIFRLFLQICCVMRLDG